MEPPVMVALMVRGRLKGVSGPLEGVAVVEPGPGNTNGSTDCLLVGIAGRLGGSTGGSDTIEAF